MKTKLRRCFTLLEAAMAMAAFMIGAVPLMGLMTATSKVNIDNRKQAMVSLLAARVMEDLKVRGWMRTYAVVGANQDMQNCISGQDLREDDEFPELSYVIEKENSLIIRYTAMARVGIGSNGKENQVRNAQGAWPILPVSDPAGQQGGVLGGIQLSPEQLKRCQNGGYFCVMSPASTDRIFSFTAATSTQLSGITHFYDNTSASGNILLLDMVYTAPVSARNKLYDFNNI